MPKIHFHQVYSNRHGVLSKLVHSFRLGSPSLLAHTLLTQHSLTNGLDPLPLQKEDSDKIGKVAYYPENGAFNLMYYPYYGKKAQVNYSQPLVAIKFLNITLNEDINIECRIISNNIPPGSERDKFAGKVSFKLRINTKQ
ncbi:unnamed protein product [Oncorhynchus mykiss]|uniref:Sodium/potassium-transporting ATPase subunit beta-2 n=1 Tax=Oncorhynchus mykiss TaxID=8022 RepID=A0A060XCM7_ONCMY|nr:unnamed protein product [Oncorhynchus mykiss]